MFAWRQSKGNGRPGIIVKQSINFADNGIRRGRVCYRFSPEAQAELLEVHEVIYSASALCVMAYPALSAEGRRDAEALEQGDLHKAVMVLENPILPGGRSQ
jgi:hypothetical protein